MARLNVQRALKGKDPFNQHMTNMSALMQWILWIIMCIAGYKSQNHASVDFQPSASCGSFHPQVVKFAPLLQCATTQWRAELSHFSAHCRVLSDEVRWPCVFTSSKRTAVLGCAVPHDSCAEAQWGWNNSQQVGILFFYFIFCRFGGDYMGFFLTVSASHVVYC